MSDVNPSLTMRRRCRLIEKVCVDCGDVFEVATTIAARCVRCHACRKVHEREKIAEANARRERVTRAGTKQIMPYLMIHDPDKSWGWHTRLSMCEINYMLRAGYLTVGTVFQYKNGGIYDVITVEGRLMMKKRKIEK